MTDVVIECDAREARNRCRKTAIEPRCAADAAEASADARDRRARRRSTFDDRDPRARDAVAGSALATDEVPRHAVRLVASIGEAEPDRGRAVVLRPFAELPQLLRAGDLVVVNDAATLPASLRGHDRGGRRFELRLSAPIAAAGSTACCSAQATTTRAPRIARRRPRSPPASA